MEQLSLEEQIHRYWESRAIMFGSRAEATQPDTYLRALENKAIIDCIREYKHDSILSVGCGNGITESQVYGAFPKSKLSGVDYCSNMVKVAGDVCPWAEFSVLDITKEDLPKEKYDIVYTQRCIINIPDEKEQIIAINRICDAVKPGGVYIMAEAFIEPLEALSKERAKVGLDPLKMRWHNQYLSDEVISNFDSNEIDIHNYSGTYFLLTRLVSPVINSTPDYKDEINRVATYLEPKYPEFSVQKVYVVRKL